MALLQDLLNRVIRGKAEISMPAERAIKGCLRGWGASGLSAEVVFQPEGKRIKVPYGSTILDAVRASGVDLTSICGGRGICGKCRVIIGRSNNISSLANVERKFLSDEEVSLGYRLACQTIIFGSLTVRVPEESRTGRQRLLVEGVEALTPPEPSIKKLFVRLDRPSLLDVRSDADRLLDALRDAYGLDGLKLDYE
ncbi:MAG: 2Fe-2S iron-sulfur cluster-binding protein, partial [Candidatus Bathyarchaeia archaeon]